VSVAASATAPATRWRPSPWLLAWLVVLLLAFGLRYGEPLWPWALEYPRAWELPLKDWISAFMKWLVNEASLGVFTFKELTRSLAWLLQLPLDAARGLLVVGFRIPFGPEHSFALPPLSWLGLLLACVLLAYRVGDAGLALLVGLCFGYLALFGQWQSAMVTLSSIAIAVPLGVAGGLALGILGYRSERFERAITPLLDLMQTVPVFAYLIPVLFLFGFGPVAAMIATIIYAMPPMVRVTMLALKQVPTEVVELGRMTGCSRHQLTWKVLIPGSAASLMVGVNQVIMLSLNMVIIASMIGAGGLGYDVLTALRKLAIGQGFEAGIAITVLAIALDRLSQAFARHQPTHAGAGRLSPRLLRRHPNLLAALALIAVTTLLGTLNSFFASYPQSLQISTGPFWDELVRWINVNFFDQLEAVKTFLLLHLLVPVKRFLLELPWVVVVAAVALGGLRLGGWRLAALLTSLALFIVVNGQWSKAMVSVYLCGISVLFACAIGIPIGIWAARNERAHQVVQAVIDTLQTLPSFVYLMPVVMLFRVGEFSAMVAVVAYALVPAIRYTDLGIRKVPPALIEAAQVCGCTRRQILFKVQLKLALPEIMLGVNQTIMMALSMLVITALVGTRDLGQEVYIALTKADTGRGLVAGISVACIAIIADRLIAGWARRRKLALGLP